LVVEDEPQIAELIEETLQTVGHECVRARDSEEADRVLSSEAVDGITLDVRMPGRDGLDWLGALFAARPELARRTLVVTGTSLSPEDCRHLARCGASMLAKPFRVEELVDTISKQLSPIHGSAAPRD
jgi:DNA-binding response OmpR family regulator